MPSVAAYRCGAFLARHTPGPIGRSAADAAALAAVAVGKQRRLLVRRNLERALGRRLARGEAIHRVTAVFKWYAHYYLESFKLPELDANGVDTDFGYQGFGILQRAVRSGTGPVLVLPHLGSWEWAAYWLALIPKIKVTAVVEPLEPPEVFEWFAALRRKLGIEIVPAGPSAGGLLVAAVRKGHVVCLVSDRDITGNGTPVMFFGERTRLPAGPAMLALRTGAPLIPAAVYSRGRGRHAVVLSPINTERRGRIRSDTARVVQDYANSLEHLIRMAPEQWHLMSPNWPSDYDALGRPRPSAMQNL